MANHRDLVQVQVLENLVVPDISTNVNKSLKAYESGKGGKDKVVGVDSLSLILESNMVIASFVADRTNRVTTIGIPLTVIKTLVFAELNEAHSPSY